MKVVSVNVGLPRTVLWGDRPVTTGIFKSPVDGPRMLRQFNLDGDGQADLQNHGGRAKALYVYPSEHYEPWQQQLPGTKLSWGMFGENLTTEGLREQETYIGDQFRIGAAIAMVTQPRIPCYKLGIRLGRDDIVKMFLESGRSGIYFAVLQEGVVVAGDSIERIHQDSDRISVAEINGAYVNGANHLDLIRRAVRLPALPPGIRDHFLDQLSSIGDGH